MTCSGVSTDDFNQIFEDFYRTVSYRVVSKSVSTITGDETSTFAAASNVDLIFFTEENRWLFDKQGLVELGDAYVMAKTSVGIKKYDQFTISGKTYYIQNVINRYVLGTAMFDYGVCFLVA